jgi:hypothetical protein
MEIFCPQKHYLKKSLRKKKKIGGAQLPDGRRHARVATSFVPSRRLPFSSQSRGSGALRGAFAEEFFFVI